MPWKETSAMGQKIQLIADWLSGDYRKSELSDVYGISRPTVDKWIVRYQELGTTGLEELSRALQGAGASLTPLGGSVESPKCIISIGVFASVMKSLRAGRTPALPALTSTFSSSF